MSLIREIEIFNKTLRIHQDFNEELGATVWDAAIVLLKYFENLDRFPHHYFKGKRIIELGAGTGAPGLAAAVLGANVILSDRAPLVPLMTKNIEENNLTDRAKAVALEWGTDVSSLSPPFDVVLLSDLIAKLYHDVVDKLLDTLAQITTPESRILLSFELRSKEDAVFFEKLKDKGFTYTMVDDEHEFWKSPDIGIFEIRKAQ